MLENKGNVLISNSLSRLFLLLGTSFAGCLLLTASRIDIQQATVDILVEAVKIHLYIRSIADVEEVNRVMAVVALCIKRV